jgi:hypothetical protein
VNTPSGTNGKIRAFTTPEEVLEYYEYGETIDMVGKKTMHYLSYLSALDTQDTEVQKKLGELEYLGIQLSELTLFVSQEWKELGAEKIRAFAESPLLAAYRNDLIESANNVQYILDEKVEQALNKKSRALGIFGLHEELRSSFEFPWTFQNLEDENGVEKKLTEEEIRAFAKNPNRDIRREGSRIDEQRLSRPSESDHTRQSLHGYREKLELFDGTPRLQDGDEQAQYQRTSPRQCGRYTHVWSAEILSALSAISPCKTEASRTPWTLWLRCPCTDFQNREKNPLRRSVQNRDWNVWGIW